MSNMSFNFVSYIFVYISLSISYILCQKVTVQPHLSLSHFCPSHVWIPTRAIFTESKTVLLFFQARLFATNWCYAYNPVRLSMSRWWPRRPAWVSVWRKRNLTSPTIPVIKAPDCPTLMKGWFSTVLSAPKCTLFVQVNFQSQQSTTFKKIEFSRQN